MKNSLITSIVVLCVVQTAYLALLPVQENAVEWVQPARVVDELPIHRHHVELKVDVPHCQQYYEDLCKKYPPCQAESSKVDIHYDQKEIVSGNDIPTSEMKRDIKIPGSNEEDPLRGPQTSGKRRVRKSKFRFSMWKPKYTTWKLFHM